MNSSTTTLQKQLASIHKKVFSNRMPRIILKDRELYDSWRRKYQERRNAGDLEEQRLKRLAELNRIDCMRSDNAQFAISQPLPNVSPSCEDPFLMNL